METLAAYLTEHPFLRGMRPDHIELMVGCASNVRFDPEQYIFREGETAHRFYFIRHGRLALEVFRPHKGNIVIQTLEANSVLGWSWLVEPYTRHFDCRAVELTRAIALDGACLRGKCEDDPLLGYELMKRFVHLMEDELNAMRLRLLDIYDAPIK